MKCHQCKTTIQGKYYVYSRQKKGSTEKKEWVICEPCSRKLIHCTLCNAPIIDSKPKLYQDTPYCPSCFNELIICDGCKKIIKGKYYAIDSIKLCERCNASKPVCTSCHKPILNDAYEYELNRFLHPSCKNNTLLTTKDLNKATQKALGYLNQLFGIRLKSIKKLALVSHSEMIREGRQINKDKGISAAHLAGVANSKNEISILKGSSISEAITTIAHELGHLWQYEHWIDYHDRKLRDQEGFCEWLGFKIALHMKEKSIVENLLKNPDPIYGDGLRYVLGLEKKVSKKNLIYGNW